MFFEAKVVCVCAKQDKVKGERSGYIWWGGWQGFWRRIREGEGRGCAVTE